jgi:anaerobic ribonucleoside-triphosphate reductase activating protein
VDIEDLVSEINNSDNDLTISGGEPLLQCEGICELLTKILPTEEVTSKKKNIWLYTGYTYEEIRDNPLLNKIIEKIDTLVDGPYIDELRDLSLEFRGSSNQRIIHINK